jgi:hypothetical protein
MAGIKLPKTANQRRKTASAGAVFLLAAASLIGSLSAAARRPYPGVALGWGLLYHVERACFLLGVVALFVLIVWRALKAEFPIKFGPLLEYAPKEAVQVSRRMQVNLEERIVTIENRLKIGPRPGDTTDQPLP